METIRSLAELEQFLKKHTGSGNIPYELKWKFETGPYNPAEEYIAYSRNKVTIAIERIGDSNWEILEVFPKVKRDAFRQGIDEAFLNQLQPYLTGAWKIRTYYRGHLAVELPYLANKNEALIFLKMGFIAVDVDRNAGTTTLDMR